jgi:hypothetical protein
VSDYFSQHPARTGIKAWDMKGMKTVKLMKAGVSPASQAGDEETAG